MSPAQELLAVAAALYLFECLVYLPRSGLLFWSGSKRHSRIIRAGNLPGSVSHGLTLGMPAPPLGTVHVTEFWPITIAPTGLCAGPVQQLDIEPGWQDGVPFIAFDAVRSVVARGRWVCINDAAFAACAGERSAEQWADLVRMLAAAPPAERGPRIEAIVATGLSLRQIEASVAELRCATRGLRIWCNALLVFIFGVAPALVWRWTLMQTWWVLALGLVTLWLAALVAFVRVHRRLRPTRRAERWQRVLLLGLTPVATVRANDALARDALVRFHPLALARVLCDDDTFYAFARSVYADLVHPPRHMAEDPAVLEAEAWLRSRLRAATERFLRDAGLEPANLLRSPTPENETCQTYCPRCAAQHVAGATECAACPGVTLLPLRAAAVSSASRATRDEQQPEDN